MAKQHVSEFSGRSRFLVFVRLPEGRKSTFAYFQTLWNVPQPWIPLSQTNNQIVVNPDLPQFPAGTQVALVRQMTLFDDHGNLVPTPITESVQIQGYRTITANKEERYESENFEELTTRSGQAFHEITLSRPRSILLAADSQFLVHCQRREPDVISVKHGNHEENEHERDYPSPQFADRPRLNVNRSHRRTGSHAHRIVRLAPSRNVPRFPYLFANLTDVLVARIGISLALTRVVTSLKETDRAFESLQKAYDNHEYQLSLLKSDSRLDRLRSDPRYADLLRRMGLPQPE